VASVAGAFCATGFSMDLFFSFAFFLVSSDQFCRHFDETISLDIDITSIAFLIVAC
jgi:hypothetical protein